MMEDAIQLLELHERISKSGSGRRYFTGTLNGCRVVVLQDENVRPEDGIEAVWSVFLQPGKVSRWNRTETGTAHAAGRVSKARQRAVEDINKRYAEQDLGDDVDR
jgi:hypothetical protein